MTDEQKLEREYEDILAVFNTPGWKLLAEDFGAVLKARIDVRNCKNLDETRGAITELEFVLSSPERYLRSYEELKRPTLPDFTHAEGF